LKANDPCWCGSGKKFKRCHRAEGPVKPGLRGVPEGIERPDYAASGEPVRWDEPLVKSPDAIERMRHAGQVAAEVLSTIGAAVAPGVTTDALDELCHDATIARDAYPSPLNYWGFPKSLCTSVNEVICHGIPSTRQLVEGDIVNLDVTVYIGGVHGDCNATYAVGAVDDDATKLMSVTRASLGVGIAAVHKGRPISDIGKAIQAYAEGEGFGVVRAFVGHGIGAQFHSGLHVPHYFDPRADTVMEPGMTFTIEPMLTEGDWRHVMLDDGWTAITADGKRSAQFEHTIVVTADGAEVLTASAF
jgi:methionyl aminopeptidase